MSDKEQPGKVVKLRPVANAAPVVKMPPAMQKACVHASELLAKYLAELFDGADDRLFDMADKASQEERNAYLDAMRDLRIKRAGLEAGFRQAVEHGFRALVASDEENSLMSADVDFDTLALVDEQQMEASMAGENMARRVRDECDEQLRILNHRLEHLIESRREVQESNGPLEPRQVVRYFNEGMDQLELDPRNRMVVLKLFEREVLADLGYVITETNNVLVAAGVLPDLKAPPIKPARRPGERKVLVDADQAAATGSEQSAERGGGPGAGDGQVYDMLQELLTGLQVLGGNGLPGAQMPANMAVMRDGVAYVNGAPVAEGIEVHEVGSDELMSVLGRLQRLEEKMLSEHADAMDVREGLSSALSEDDDGDESVHALGPQDSDVINLVSMLFDMILDDDSVANDIKVLLGRLQIPLLKVAIRDPSFFNTDDHPARELLNSLATIGAQWSPDQGYEDEIYEQVRATVYRVLNDFDDDPHLFAHLLDEVNQYLSRQQNQLERVETRVRQVEEGRDRAEAARAAAAEILDKRLHGRSLPGVALQTLQEAWEQVLYLTYLRNGGESEEWRRRVKLVDALVWSVLPHRAPADQQRLRELSPRLLNGLKAGLDAVGYDGLESTRLVKGLADIHDRLLAGQETDRVRVTREPAAPIAEPHGSSETLPADHPRVLEVKALKIGQWLEFREGETMQRGRLAANIRDGSKLVFINRRGVKISEHTAASLALALEQDRARVIEEGRLFDRALESMIGDLRRMQHPPA